MPAKLAPRATFLAVPKLLLGLGLLCLCIIPEHQCQLQLP